MPVKKRSRSFRREQAGRDKAKRRQPAGPRKPKAVAYDRDARVNVKADLRDFGMWL